MEDKHNEEIKEQVKDEIVETITTSLSNESNEGGYLDRGIGKFTSRKLLAVMAGTGFLISGHIIASDWILLVCLWIGVQGVLDIYKIRASIPDYKNKTD